VRCRSTSASGPPSIAESPVLLAASGFTQLFLRECGGRLRERTGRQAPGREDNRVGKRDQDTATADRKRVMDCRGSMVLAFVSLFLADLRMDGSLPTSRG
jgi:hypothetical protein